MAAGPNIESNIEYGRNIELRDQQMICVRRFAPGSQIVCLSGRLWLTFDRDREDHILLPGDWFLPRRAARGAIIYAIDPSEVVLLEGERVSLAMALGRLLRGRFALRS